MKIQSTDELVRRLNNLTSAINSDRDLRRTLNRGACAFFAVRVAKAVKLNVLGLSIFDNYEKAKEIFPKVMAESNACKKNQTLKFWLENGIDFGHVVIKFMINDTVMCYDGVYGLMTEAKCHATYAWCGEEIGIAPVDLIAPLTKTTKGWNPAFSGHEKVERLINGHLKDKWNA